MFEPRCSICKHDRHGEIDAALVSNVSVRGIARTYGLTASSLRRHRDAHLSATIAKAAATDELERAEGLADSLAALQRQSLRVLTDAALRGDDRLALAAVKECRANLELWGRVTGELTADAPSVSLVMSQGWLEVRGAVLAALEPYPEARERVAARLIEAEARHVD